MIMTVMMIMMIMMMTPMQQKASIYLCFLFHASSVWAQHRRRAPQRSQELGKHPSPPPEQQQRCWSCCWWVASLSGFSFGCCCCCCCYFVFGFFPPFVILAIFTSGTNTLLFCFGSALFFVCKLEGGTSKI